MKKEDLIYILHKKHALNIEELKKYTKNIYYSKNT